MSSNLSINLTRYAALVVVLSLLSTMALGQVSEVKKESAENKSKKESGSNNDGGDGNSVFVDFFFNITFRGVVMAQRNMLDRRFDQPDLVGLEGMLQAGYYPEDNNMLLLPQIRGNWGLFSTSFRVNRMQDQTGFFRTLDWQLLILNIVARPGVTFRVGSGLSYETESEDAFNEHYLSLELHFLDREVNTALDFRISKDYETGATPRWELNPRVDYRIFNIGKLDVNVMGGFLFQRYYSNVEFYFVQTGLNLSFY